MIYLEDMVYNLQTHISTNLDPVLTLIEAEKTDLVLPRIQAYRIGLPNLERDGEDVILYISSDEGEDQNIGIGVSEANLKVDIYLLIRGYDDDDSFKIRSRYKAALDRILLEIDDGYFRDIVINKYEVLDNSSTPSGNISAIIFEIELLKEY